MSIERKDPWVAEVYNAIKHYQRALELKHHPARGWPAVQEVERQGVDPVIAIRRILDQACQTLEATHPTEARLLREQFLRGRTPDVIAADGGFDKTSFHRWRNQALSELAVLVAEANRAAKRRLNRFLPKLPVIGFEHLMVDIVGHIRNPEGPAVVIIEGLGGLGKTTLARMVADQVAAEEDFTDVIWISMQQLVFDPWFGQCSIVQQPLLEISGLVYQLATELGIDIPHDYAAIRDAVRTRCKQSPYLIIIDNIETIQDLAALAPLIELLIGPTRVLLTTREHTAQTLPATMPRLYVPLSEVDAPTSLQILRQAAAYNHAQGLINASDADLAQIYALTGGNPLALWLIAGQARGLPWNVFLQELTGQATAGSRIDSMYSYLYQRSWEQLSSHAQRVLFVMHRCEVGGSYDLVWRLSRLDPRDFRDAVEELMSRMLLHFDGQVYTIHRLTHSFMHTFLTSADNFSIDPELATYIQELPPIQAQYLLQHGTSLLPETAIPQAVGLIRDWVSYLNQPGYAIRFAYDFHSIVETWSYWGEWVRGLDLALSEVLVDEFATLRIHLLNYRSQVAREVGDYESAQRCATEAYQLAKTMPAPDLMAQSLNKLGLVALFRDHLIEAQAHFEQASVLGADNLPPLETGHIMMNLGLVMVRQGMFPAAHNAFDYALHHYQTQGDAVYVAKVICNRIDLQRRSGCLAEVPAEFLQARDTFKRVGAHYTYGLTENDLGCIYLSLGQFELAEQAFQSALIVIEQIGAVVAKARVLSNLGELYVVWQRWEDAQIALDQARQLAIIGTKPLLVATIDVDRGHMFASQGDATRAEHIWRSALAIQEVHGAEHAAQKTRDLLADLVAPNSSL